VKQHRSEISEREIFPAEWCFPCPPCPPAARCACSRAPLLPESAGRREHVAISSFLLAFFCCRQETAARGGGSATASGCLVFYPQQAGHQQVASDFLVVQGTPAPRLNAGHTQSLSTKGLKTCVRQSNIKRGVTGKWQRCGWRCWIDKIARGYWQLKTPLED
jgi:hypothetical protein